MKTIAAGLICFAILLSGCSIATPTLTLAPTNAPTTAPTPVPTEVPATVKRISAQDAKARLDADDSIVLVDVRTKEEYAEKRIPGSVLLPLDQLEEKASTVLPDKEATYFVYCRSGNRSATAAAILVGMGYRDIHDLGGILDWPYETTSG